MRQHFGQDRPWLEAVDDGAIALQLHAGGQANMRFKDIYIRDLSHR